MRLGLIFISWLFSTGISSIFDVLLVYFDIYNVFISLIFYILNMYLCIYFFIFCFMF